MINIFTSTSPNRSGVGAIDNPDQFEQVFDTYYIPETSEKFSWTTFRWSVLRKFEFLVVLKEAIFFGEDLNFLDQKGLIRL